MVPRHERRVWFYYLLSSHDHIELGHRVTFYLLKKREKNYVVFSVLHPDIGLEIFSRFQFL
jgi:hypothetical protein